MQVATCMIIYLPLLSVNSGGTWIEWGLLPGLGKFTDQRNQRDPGVAKETDRWFSSLCASSTFSSIVLGQWTHWLSKINMCWLRAAKSTCWCFFFVASSLCVHRSSVKKFYSASLSASLKIIFTCTHARSPKAVSRFEAKVPEHGPWGWIWLL